MSHVPQPGRPVRMVTSWSKIPLLTDPMVCPSRATSRRRTGRGVSRGCRPLASQYSPRGVTVNGQRYALGEVEIDYIGVKLHRWPSCVGRDGITDAQTSFLDEVLGVERCGVRDGRTPLWQRFWVAARICWAQRWGRSGGLVRECD